MPLTREFKETMVELCKDAGFRQEMLREILELYISGEVDTAYSNFKDYMNATASFSDIAEEMQVKVPSLRRMFGITGNPTAKNFSKAYNIAISREHIKPEQLINHEVAVA